ncbi:class-II fumarase/aspartase family protein [Kocuria rosea]|uniref:class-II fumarase/aspartase family protein n=1 Tax=Kocuria rosea TaxID=1275 RepID=UPI0025416BA5|nr:adenylosuccinate lyase family protein [Kocuria rosea]WIG15857.1 adenylosuccinate lyase family protein [Kocuria rosea]
MTTSSLHKLLTTTAGAPTASTQIFDLLLHNYGDAQMGAVFSQESMVASWLDTEAALATAQGDLGVITEAEATAVASACRTLEVDYEALWTSARNVGYPILGLVRQIAASLPVGPDGRVHYGATTQDIMDTGLVLQLSQAAMIIAAHLEDLGEVVASLVAEHAGTVMPGRTHGQQAVPTTFGAQLAPLLAELTRQRARWAEAAEGVRVISLFGAGGTNAAQGPSSQAVRAAVAEALGLRTTDVSWHPARDGLAAYGQCAAGLAATCARMARNVIDLSRTEIGEIGEATGQHRGASSTMPQKANPILAEGIIGLSGVAGPLSTGLFRAMEVPQERAAGEWQIEWFVLPHLMGLSAAALKATTELVEGLRVDADRMRANLDHDGGLIMAEAYMISLAPVLGRETAHDVVYSAVGQVRAGRATLTEAVTAAVAAAGADLATTATRIDPADYLGEATAMCAAAVEAWTRR